MVVQCSMKGCGSHSRYNMTRRHFYRFPSDEERCKKWVDATGNPGLWEKGAAALHRSFYLCDLHFQPSDRYQKKLKKDALPFPCDQNVNSNQCKCSLTKTDTKGDPSTDVNVGASTSNDGTTTDSTPSMEPLSDESREAQLLSNKKFVQPTTEMQMLIDLQLRLKTIRMVKDCASGLKLFALNLYLSKPIAYKAIRNILQLPSEKELRKCNIDIGTNMGLVMQILQSKVKSLKEPDKYCTVCVDRMPLKKFLFYHINKDKVIGFADMNDQQMLDPATEVYMVLARGISLKWEQPLGYCFLDENQTDEVTDAWLDDMIGQIQHTGLKVVALVTDHRNFYNRVRNRIVSIVQPYFCINGTKIYCIFDVPQLIISLRNLLMNHELAFKDGDGSSLIASWEPIRTLYLGSRIGVPIVLNLTNSHINPNESEKTEIKYAAQVFSKSVSSAFEMLSRTRPEWQNNKVQGTRKLTALVNDVFDILNSSSSKHQFCEYKNAFTGEPYQIKALREFMEFLTNVKVTSDIQNSDSNCISGLRISIMSIISLLRDLKPEGIHSLLTQRFNMDALHRFFDSVTQKAKGEKPTPVEFHKAFRQRFLAELFRCSRTNSDAVDVRQLVRNVNLRLISTRVLKSNDFQKTIEVKTVDYRFELPKSDTFEHVCRYLMNKCFEVHKCPFMTNLVQKKHDDNNSERNNSASLDDIMDLPCWFGVLIKNLEMDFNAHFGNKLENGLGTGILIGAMRTKPSVACKCFPLPYLKRLFIRLRIFQILRYNNRNFCDESFRFTIRDQFNDDVKAFASMLRSRIVNKKIVVPRFRSIL